MMKAYSEKMKEVTSGILFELVYVLIIPNRSPGVPKAENNNIFNMGDVRGALPTQQQQQAPKTGSLLDDLDFFNTPSQPQQLRVILFHDSILIL